MELAMEEIRYFDVLLQQLESASVKDIEEIREELIEGGYIRRKAKRGFKKKAMLNRLLRNIDQVTKRTYLSERTISKTII